MDDLNLVTGRAVRGRFPVTIMQGEAVLVAGEVNPHRPDDIDAFLKQASERFPGLNGRGDVLRSELLQLAAPKPQAVRPRTDGLILDPFNPLDIARRLRANQYQHPDGPTILYAGDLFHVWNPTTGAYEQMEPAAVRAAIYRYTDPALKLVTRGNTESAEPFKPTKTTVENVLDAFKATCYVKVQPPAWLMDDAGLPDPRDIIIARNGMVRITAAGKPSAMRTLTPKFFTANALDYEFIPSGATCEAWLNFLSELWPDDPGAIDTLGEWFGYVLTQHTDLQKILLLIGPMRSGKGTIARILAAMIGLANVCGPTLSSLATNFGLWSWIGKQLAIISDARLSGRTDLAIIVERLLAISGEDFITVDRKNLPPITLRLPTRIMVLSNELPRLSDASGALANRFVVLRLSKSYLGHEDTGLYDRLAKELPGILLWAIAGYQRLRQRGHFKQSNGGAEAIQEMTDLASPVSAFVREWCNVKAGLAVPTNDLYEAWALWSHEQGTARPSDRHVFGRDLRAAFPAITSGQRRDEDRYREYRGIDLTETAKATLSYARNSKQAKDQREAGRGN